MIEKRARTKLAVEDIIARRWSGRAYDPARPVEREKLLVLLEAARWSPSCFGEQPWRFIVWDRCADPEHWRRAFLCLTESNQAWAQRAPVLLLAAADDLFSHNHQPNRWAQYDTGAASMSLCLQATSLGLMAHQMGGFNAKRLRADFLIPEHVSCMAMIALGYQLPKEQLPDDLRERELAPRSRKSLEDNFFLGVWGKGWV